MQRGNLLTVPYYKEVDSDDEGPASSYDDNNEARAHRTKAARVSRGREVKEDRPGDTYGAGRARKRKARAGSERDVNGVSFEEALKAEAARTAPYTHELLFKLPFELFTEICGYLDLPDLVHLVNVSPQLQARLLSPAVKFLWTGCRIRSGMKLPSNMSDTQLALHLEGTRCSFCDATRTSVVDKFIPVCRDCERVRSFTFGSWPAELGKQHPLLHKFKRPGSRLLLDDFRHLNFELQRLQQLADQLAQPQPAAVSSSTQDVAEPPAKYFARWQECRRGERIMSLLCQVLRQNNSARSRLRDVREREIRKLAQQQYNLRAEQTPSIVSSLLEKHGWTLEEAGLAETEVLRNPSETFDTFTSACELQSPPSIPPDITPSAWKVYKAALLASPYPTESKHEATRHKRKKIVKEIYNEARSHLSLSPGAAPWCRLRKLASVKLLYDSPLCMSRDPAVRAEYLGKMKDAIVALAEKERVDAIRDILATHQDIPLHQVPRDPALYPEKKYNEAFFERVMNRFEVDGKAFLTYEEALELRETSHHPHPRPEWRRAVAHVVNAAKLPKRDQGSLEKLDALGAAFKWTNGPRYYKGRFYDWRRMLELLLQHGPRGMHLQDLKGVEIIYRKLKTKVKPQVEHNQQDEQQDEQREASLPDDTGKGRSSGTERDPNGSPSDATTLAASPTPPGRLRRSGRSAQAASAKSA